MMTFVRKASGSVLVLEHVDLDHCSSRGAFFKYGC
jgi:hypothetical protein